VRTLERYRYSFAALGIVLLVLPALPGIGREINGARIWISVGPLNFQPGEAAKLTLAAFLAAYLVEKRELLAVSTRRIGPLSLPDPKHLVPLLGAWGVSVLIMVRQKDLGSSLLFFTLFVVLLWVATDRAAYLMIGTVMFGAGAFVAHQLFGHVQARFRIWIDPWSEAKGAGYQLVEAAFAMADGGLVGTGLGRGDSARIPARETDFIFAVIAEELGLVGATAVLAAFVLLVGTVLRIALRAEVPFEKMLATALATLLGVQSVLIIGGVVRVLPLTGVTLPFVSYGGSSLLANYVLLALVVRISDDSGRRVLRRAAEAEAAATVGAAS
jgi:peptidoglycan glycosyltransferase